MASKAPWKTREEAYAAFVASAQATKDATDAGSLQVTTDEGFTDHIQFVAESEWTYQDVYYAWPQLDPSQWSRHGFPVMQEDANGLYGALVRIHDGEWKGSQGIYLRQHPSSSTHDVALTGPISAGTLRIISLPTIHFRIKMLQPTVRGGVFVSYKHARDILQSRQQSAS